MRENREPNTLDIRPLSEAVLRHLPARNVISRWDGLDVYSGATASTLAYLLNKLEQGVPFTARDIQVDVGSAFEATFEEEC